MNLPQIDTDDSSRYRPRKRRKSPVAIVTVTIALIIAATIAAAVIVNLNEPADSVAAKHDAAEKKVSSAETRPNNDHVAKLRNRGKEEEDSNSRIAKSETKDPEESAEVPTTTDSKASPIGRDKKIDRHDTTARQRGPTIVGNGPVVPTAFEVSDDKVVSLSFAVPDETKLPYELKDLYAFIQYFSSSETVEPQLSIPGGTRLEISFNTGRLLTQMQIADRSGDHQGRAWLVSFNNIRTKKSLSAGEVFDIKLNDLHTPSFLSGKRFDVGEGGNFYLSFMYTDILSKKGTDKSPPVYVLLSGYTTCKNPAK